MFKRPKISFAEDLSSDEVEALLEFLELTESQRARVPLFVKKSVGSGSKKSINIEDYKKYLNKLIDEVTEENEFTGKYSSSNYTNELPGAISYAISKEHEKIDLTGEPNLVLQQLGECLKHCTFDFEGPGKVYDFDEGVFSEIDESALSILTKEKKNIKVSVLKGIVHYFEPDYSLNHISDYGYEVAELKSYKIMHKLINGGGGGEEVVVLSSDEEEEEEEE